MSDLRAALAELAARHYNEGSGEWSGRSLVCGECGRDWPCPDRRDLEVILAVFAAVQEMLDDWERGRAPTAAAELRAAINAVYEDRNRS